MRREFSKQAFACAIVTLALTPAFAATLSVDQNDGGCSDVAGTPYCTIAAAAADAVDADEIVVEPGTYVENVVIDEDVALISSGGRAVTTIEGVSNVGALGTVQVQGNTTGVEIGRPGQGFTIVGIDNGAPGIENAAIYFRGTHLTAAVRDNEVVANGEAGLLSEFGATMTGTIIDGNEFSGQTYLGPEPGDCGFSNQFVALNVPRQLVTMGGGTGGGNTSNTAFLNNLVSGTAGDESTVAGCTDFGQGNTLATIDSNGGVITGNVFTGQTARFATQLRARGPNTSISGNNFNQDGLIGLACYSFTVLVGDDLGTIGGQNTYDRTLLYVADPADLSGSICVNPDGACCTDGPGANAPCEILSEDDCNNGGGLFIGRGTECVSDDECEELVVTFESVSATAVPGGVAIRWTTASEIDTVGFQVLREGQDGRVKRLAPVGEFVHSVAAGVFGASYEVIDRSPEAARATRYYLVDYDTFGRATQHGPFGVDRGSRGQPAGRSAR